MANRVERVLTLYDNNQQNLYRAITDCGGNPDLIISVHVRELIKTLSMNGVFCDFRMLEGWED